MVDANGNRASLTYANGTTEAYTYNTANWITGLTNSKGSTVLSSFSYTYYASGGQKSETDHTGKVTSYAYDSNNRLLTETKTENGEAVTTTYTYDANGNTLTKSTPAHGEDEASNTVYAYNSFNQLTGLNIDGTAVAYAYSAQGIRTAKRVNNLRTAYLLDGGNVAAEVQNNAVTSNYLRGVNLIRREATNETEYYLFNAHGDVVTTTNLNGTINQSYDYDAFGNEKAPDPLDSNPFRYCGEYLDAETSTYYLRARYYDPTIGRFTQQDTHWNTANMIYGDNPQKINVREDALGLKSYSYAPQITAVMQSGNTYIYCASNPVSCSDATGETLSQDKYVHNQVLNFLCLMNPTYSWTKTCIYYNGKDFWGGWGFCDLYDTETGQVWELKKKSDSYSCLKSSADRQLDRYVAGRLKDNPELPLSKGEEIAGGAFAISDGIYNYYIKYWYEGDGILRYSYEKELTEEAVTVCKIVLTAGTIYILSQTGIYVPLYEIVLG